MSTTVSSKYFQRLVDNSAAVSKTGQCFIPFLAVFSGIKLVSINLLLALFYFEDSDHLGRKPWLTSVSAWNDFVGFLCRGLYLSLFTR